MLSSDKNIETLSQLIEMLKHNFELRTEFVRLDAIDKAVRLFSAAALSVLLVGFLMAALLFASAAACVWLSQFVGLAPALLVMSGCYLLAMLAVYVFRRPCIERPLVRFLVHLLMR